jgi:hypothetical protein
VTVHTVEVGGLHTPYPNKNQSQPNKGDDRGLQETAEGAPPLSTSKGQQWRRWNVFLRRTHHRQTEMVHSHRQCGEEGSTAPLQTQEAEEFWLVTQNPDNLLQMHNSRACYRAISQPGTATALPSTARLSRD